MFMFLSFCNSVCTLMLYDWYSLESHYNNLNKRKKPVTKPECWTDSRGILKVVVAGLCLSKVRLESNICWQLYSLLQWFSNTQTCVFIPSLLLLKFSDKATFDSLFPVSANMYHHTYSVSFLWFPPHIKAFFFHPLAKNHTCLKSANVVNMHVICWCRHLHRIQGQNWIYWPAAISEHM